MKRTFRPKLGIFYFMFGTPLLFGLHLAIDYASGDEPRLWQTAIWSVLTAAAFGLLATFTKLID